MPSCLRLAVGSSGRVRRPLAFYRDARVAAGYNLFYFHRWYTCFSSSTSIAPSVLEHEIHFVSLISPLSSMDSVVPQEVTTELTQILSNLVLGDNQIRSKYDLRKTPPYSPLTLLPVPKMLSMRDWRKRQNSTSLRSHNSPQRQIQKW